MNHAVQGFYIHASRKSASVAPPICDKLVEPLSKREPSMLLMGDGDPCPPNVRWQSGSGGGSERNGRAEVQEEEATNPEIVWRKWLC